MNDHVTVTRVKYLNYGKKPTGDGDSIPSKYPSDGVVIEVDHAERMETPIYLSNATLDEMRALSDDGVLEFKGWREED